MAKSPKRANGHTPVRAKADLKRCDDIKTCLGYLEVQAAKAGLPEVAHWIGIARLAASAERKAAKQGTDKRRAS